MNSAISVLHALNEREIAQHVGIKYDEVRGRFTTPQNTVANYNEFSGVIGDYCNYHFTQCVSNGGALSPREAIGRAKEILEKEYRRLDGDIVSAYNDAHYGTNGGLRGILDKLADGMKATSVEYYIGDIFDLHVSPVSWEEKVQIIREFIAQCGDFLSPDIHAHQPERYARDYTQLIRSYVSGLQRTSSIFRRL